MLKRFVYVAVAVYSVLDGIFILKEQQQQKNNFLFRLFPIKLFPPANYLVLVVGFDATGLHLETQSNLGGESKLMRRLKYGE